MKKLKINVKRIKFNIYAKIILLEIIVLCIMRFFVPILLNYPPMSEEKVFQSQIEPLSHTAQYILLGTMGIIAYILCLSIFCSNIFKYLNMYAKDKTRIPKKLIEIVRTDCFSIPQKIVIVQVVLIILVLFMLFFMMDASIQICFKFLLIYFTFFTVIAIIATILIKQDLNVVIKSTYTIDEDYSDFKMTSEFSMNLLFNLVPFFLVIIITISLLGYAKVNSAIGEGNYNYYKLQFKKTDFNGLSLKDLLYVIPNITKKNEDDYFFIIIGDKYYTTAQSKQISDFFIKYVQTYYDQTNGRAYEYYGVEEEGYVQKVQLSDLDTPIYIGYKYSTTNTATSTFFISLSIVAIIIYIFILLVWSKGISKNLEDVTNNLVQIAKGKNAISNKVLPVTSTDELRRTYCSI